MNWGHVFMCIVFIVHCSDCCSHALSWTQLTPWGPFIGMEKCWTQDIELEVGDSQAPWGTLLHWKNVGPRELVGQLQCVGMEKCQTQHINQKWVTPRLPEDCIGVEKCRTQGHSNGPGDLYSWPSLGQFRMTHPFSFQLCSQRLVPLA